jgi:hypothetical protein
VRVRMSRTARYSASASSARPELRSTAARFPRDAQSARVLRDQIAGTGRQHGTILRLCLFQSAQPVQRDRADLPTGHRDVVARAEHAAAVVAHGAKVFLGLGVTAKADPGKTPARSGC